MRILVSLLLMLTGEEILRQLRENLSYESSKFVAEIEIKKGKRVITKSFNGLSTHSNFLIEFTNPEDRGVKYLKVGHDLFVYLPDIDDMVRLSGDMLKQSFMGSDLSYQDLMEEDPLRYYRVIETADTVIEGKSYKILELEDTTGNAQYQRVKLIVDIAKNTWLKEELYTKGQRKLKEMEVLEYRSVKGKYYPVKVVVRDFRLKDSYTTLTLKEIDFNIPVPPRIFKKEYLRK